MILQALSLGLSAGLYCTTRCVPTLAPLLLLSPQKGLKTGLGMVCIFLGGRFVAYGLLGFLAGFAGSLGREIPYSDGFLIVAQVVLGAVMIVQSFYSCSPGHCPGKKMLFGTKKTIFFAGILNSITLCPPLLLALSLAIEKGNPWQGFLFFIVFFVATSIYIVPVSIAALKFKSRILLRIARIVCVGTGIYFIGSGLSVAFSSQYVEY